MLQDRVLKRIEQRLLAIDVPVSLNLWNGRRFSSAGAAPTIEVTIKTPKALRSLIQPTLGRLAESYVEKEIDLHGSMRDIIAAGESLCNAPSAIYERGKSLFKWWKHTPQADRNSIQYHYDVSNDFYALWLDQRRVYSCGYFRHETDTLDQAQEQKLEHICRKLNLQRNERFLDIGCGWGALLLWAAEHHGVNGLGITLSRNQYEYVQSQIQARGLQGRCEVRLCDYRDLSETEPFDKISSVGMFEHVGRGNLPVYFGKIFRLLRPGGWVLNHGITAATLDNGGLGSGISEFIDKYVFPGGELVHVSDVIGAMAGQQLECWDSESLRPHYAKTLWHWVDRLEASKARAVELVGEDKYRIWQIYMAGSAHAFSRGWMSVFQVLAAKPLESGAVNYPLTREHVYADLTPARQCASA